MFYEIKKLVNIAFCLITSKPHANIDAMWTFAVKFLLGAKWRNVLCCISSSCKAVSAEV